MNEKGWAAKEIQNVEREKREEAEKIAFEGMYSAGMPYTGENPVMGTTIFGGSTVEATMPDGKPYFASLEIPTYLWKIIGEPKTLEVFFRLPKE